MAKKKIVYHVWPKEIEKWDLPFRYSIVHGTKKHKRLWQKRSIKITNYDSLEWLTKQKDWFRRGKRIMLVIDESSKLRNTGTLRFRSLKKILPRFDRRYILTGSPAPNGLEGLFGQIYTLDHGAALGKFITHYRNKYFEPFGFMGYQWKLQEGAAKKIFKRLADLVLRYGNDQLNLPPLTIKTRYVDLPDDARELYKELEKEFIVQLKRGEIVAANAAVASGKLRQIANGGVFYNRDQSIEADPRKGRTWATIHDEKCANLVDLLEELQGEPALIAYEFKHDMYRLKKYFKKHAPQFAKAPFVGSHTKERKLKKLLRLWDKGLLPVMFGQPDSVAEGLNLQGKGGIVIFFSMTWNLENYEQFIQRVWRQGQKRRVLVYRILARNTVDELIAYTLKRKDRVQQDLLKAMEGFRKAFTDERIQTYNTRRIETNKEARAATRSRARRQEKRSARQRQAS